MAQEEVKGWLCPICGRRGEMVQKVPHIERRCPKGHRWADRKPPLISSYIPLSVRLEEAHAGLAGALSALTQAETMIKDCSSFLTPEQRIKLAVNTELHQLMQAKVRVKQFIEIAGG